MAVQDAAVLLVGLLLLFRTWGVWANVEVNMEDRVEVFRGKASQITCMFNSSEGIGALIIQWYYVTRAGDKKKIFYQDSTSKVVDRGTQFTDRISVNGTGANGEVVLTINNVQLEDEVEFICLVKSLTEAAGEGRTQLKVFEIPELPVIEGVQTGISVNEDRPSKIGTCEVKNGFPKPTIIWYRNNTPLYNVQDEVEVSSSVTYESSGLLSVKSELRMKVVKEDKDDEFYCEINYAVPGETRMTESKRINITVYYPSTAVNIWVESPKGKIKEGDQIELHCRGDGNMPSSVISIKHENDQEVTDTDMLVLNNVTRRNSGVYECTSLDTDTFNTILGNTAVFVNYLDPARVSPELVNVDQGKELNATCNALSSLQTHTAWFKNGKQVAKDHHLMQRDASFDMSGTYECVVTVPEIEGMETRGTLVVYVHGPPHITEPNNMEMEETTDNMVDLSCTVRGYPTPSITWTTSDGNVLKTDSERKTEKGFESVVKLKVTSDLTAFCNASNDYGNASVTFKIKAIKPETAIPPKKIKKEGSGVIIAVIIVCILLLAILGSMLYFLYKKGKICGRSGKQDLTKEKSNKDNIVVEMKNDNTEEAVLLGVNGEKQPPSDQGGEYLDVQK